MVMTGRNVWETQNLNVNYPPLDYIHKKEKNYAKTKNKFSLGFIERFQSSGDPNHSLIENHFRIGSLN